MLKFGYPETVVRETEHWTVLVRPHQPTLGSVVLAANSDAEAFGALPFQAFAALHDVVSDLERALAAVVSYSRLNYLMLMMVDPHVHFHVLPRYEGVRTIGTLTVPDPGWPGPPRLAEVVEPGHDTLLMLRDVLRQGWPA